MASFQQIFFNLKAKTLEYLRQENEDFVLVGLSLGGSLALALAEEKLPRLKGLIVSAAQYDLRHDCFYKLQNVVFKLLPSKFFAQKILIRPTCFSFLSQ